MHGIGEECNVLHHAEDVRVAEHQAERVGPQSRAQRLQVGTAVGSEGQLAHLEVAEAAQVGRDRGPVVRMERARQPDHPPAGQEAAGHEHRLRGRRRAVVHAGVRHLEPEDERGEGLELEGRLQRALADLGLVGRVGGRELAAQEDLVHHRRNPVRVRARAEEHCRAARAGVAGRERAHVAAELGLGQALRQGDGRARPQRGRNVREQVVDRADADGRQHGGDVLGGVGVVAAHFPCSRAMWAR